LLPRTTRCVFQIAASTVCGLTMLAEDTDDRSKTTKRSVP